MNIMIIFLSFIVSTILSVVVMRNKKSRWVAVSLALMINVIILGAAYWLFFNADKESQLFGIDFHDRYFLLVFIPVNSYLNYIILLFAKKFEQSHRS